MKMRCKSEPSTFLAGLFVLSLLVFIPDVSFSQEKFRFSKEPGVFIDEVQDVMLHSANDKVAAGSETFMPALARKWKSGRFDNGSKEIVMEITQKMSDGNLSGDAVFLGFYQVVNRLALSTLDNGSISNFLKYSNKIYKEKGLSAFKAHVQYSREFFAKGVVNTAYYMKWCLRCDKYRLSSESDFIVEMEEGDVVCKSDKDSMVVAKTKGVFRKSDMTFSGDGGKVTWRRFKLDENRVYAKFSKYSLDLKNVNMTVDSVMFYNDSLLEEPLLGRFKDEAFANNQSIVERSPSFVSYRDDCDVRNIFNGMAFRGVFEMVGTNVRVNGKEEVRAVLSVVRNNDTVADVRSKSFVIGKNKIISDEVMVKVNLEDDSLFHNGITMQYDNDSREFVFYNADKKKVFAPFFDTYHKINIFSDALSWNVDGNVMQFKSIMPFSRESRAYFRSYRYFLMFEWEKIRGMDNYNPLNVMGDYMKKYDTDILEVFYLAPFFNRTQAQVISSILQLEELGYLVYDSDKKVAYPTERMYNTLDVFNNDADYDVINIESVTQGDVPNMELDVSSCELKVNGVGKLVLSNKKNVNIKPSGTSIVVKKDLDIEFSGTMMAGLFEFEVHEGFFNYENFAISMPSVASMQCYVMVGQGTQKKIDGTIQDVSGMLYIDKTTNKSGKDDNPMYPRFECNSGAKMEFPDSRFVLEPFKIDSLLTFSTENLRFDGSFSSDIFPDFDEKLRIMRDGPSSEHYFWGFEHYTGEDGIALFGGDSKFRNIIHVDSRGFYGDGTVEFMTSYVESKHIDFFRDSLHCAKGEFRLLSVNDGRLSYPDAHIDEADVKMSARQNRLFVNTLNKKMSIYDGYAFNGTASLQATGLTGKGQFEFNAATVMSVSFNFKKTRFESDIATLKAKDADDKEAFVTTNYRTSVDFVTQHGRFRKVNDNSLITFTQNEFCSNVDNAEWDISRASLAMSGGSKGKLVSLNEKQDKLTFNTSDVGFDINNGVLTARNVDTIRLADAAVVTPDGVVNIGRNAVVQRLTNTVMLADTTSKLHKFFDVEVEIMGRNDFSANGKYLFYTSDQKLRTLTFNDIYVDSVGKTRAVCVIDEAENFAVGHEMLYKGDIKVESTRRNLEFDGYFKLENDCIDNFRWFKSDMVLDPSRIVIPLNDNDFAYNSGMFFDTVKREFFVGFLSDNDKYEPHRPAADVRGNLVYDAQSKSYKISRLTLQTDNCTITGEENVNLGFDNSFFHFNTDGKFTNDISKEELKLEVTASLDFLFDEGLLNYLAQVLHESSGGSRSRTVNEKHSMVIENLKMKWVSGMHCFINETPIHLKSILKNSVDMDLDGYLLLNYNDIPSLTLFFEYADNQWCYFCYKDGVMTSVSTNNEYINRLGEIKEKKRHFINRTAGDEYEYVLCDFEEVKEFLQIANFVKGK